MKRIFSVLFALIVVSALTFLTTTSKHGVGAVYAQSGCSVATLTGNYAHTNQGFAAPGHSLRGAEVPIAIVGVDAFDGAGNISTSFAFSFNGSIVTHVTDSGTYTVNSDCTGSITFPGGVTANMVIIGGGTEIFGIFTNPGSTVTFDDKKQ